MTTTRDNGSSPRGRGKLPGEQRLHLRPRLIPARAGKTGAACPTARHPAAHPRAGGENEDAAALADQLNGSSPRGRGKHQATAVGVGPPRLIPARAGKTLQLAVVLLSTIRLIPARAGKTTCSGRGPGSSSAHPRAGGENPVQTVDAEGNLGSSPRGRGKRAVRRRTCVAFRLIPARAGKTTRP